MRRVAAALLLLTLTGCGSTVQQTGPVGAAAAPGAPDGLSAPLHGPAPVDSAGLTVDDGTPSAQVDPGPGGASAPAAQVAPGSAPGGAGSAAAPLAAGRKDTPAAGRTNTSPIKIGFLVLAGSGDGAAQALGASNGNTISPRRAAEGIVAAFNENGGLAARQIVPVYVEFDPQGDYEGQFASACERFARDERVSAVYGLLGVHSESFEQCLAKAGVVHLEGDRSSGDRELLRQYPSLLAPLAPSVDRRLDTVMRSLARQGYLGKSNRLGILRDECTYSRRGWERTGRPLAKQLGLRVEQDVQIGCTSSFSDAGPAASRINNAVLTFRQSQVDRVLIVSNVEGAALLLFANAAESQGYRPGYALSSGAAPAVIVPQLPAGQRPQAHGVGWLPVLDTSPGRTPAATPELKRCQQLYKEQGVVAQEPTDVLLLSSACDSMTLYAVALTATGGDAAPASIVSAVDAIGSRRFSASALGASTKFGPARHDGPARSQPFAWHTSCSCMAYNGASGDF